MHFAQIGPGAALAMVASIAAALSGAGHAQTTGPGQPGADANRAAKIAGEAPGDGHAALHVGGAHHEQTGVQESGLRLERHQSRKRRPHPRGLKRCPK